jgi:hypothetical protein
MKIVLYVTLMVISVDCFSQISDETGKIIDSTKVYNGEKDLPKDLVNRTEICLADSIFWISLGQKEYAGDYLKLDNKIYCGSLRCYTTPLNVDILSFQVLNLTPYSRDKNKVYCYNTLTCEDCNGCCGGCWCDIFIVENANPGTFRYISNSYATDNINVYYQGLLIKEADIRTFKVLHNPKDFDFAVDKNYVYKRNETFKDADPFSFYCEKPQKGNNENILIIGDKNNKWEYDLSKDTLIRLDK